MGHAGYDLHERQGTAQSDVRTFWEEVARSTWGAYVTEVERRAILTAHDLAGSAGVGVDIGSEGGRWARLLTDLGWQMVCCDVNSYLLQKCREKVPTAHALRVGKDDGTIPLRSGSASLLLCIEVAPVIEAEWFVDEASRVLQDDGLVVGVFWNALSLRGLFGRVKSAVNGTFRYYQLAYRSWKRERLAGHFRIVHEEGYCWFPFSRTSNSQMVPYLTRVEKQIGLRRLTSLSPWIAFVAQKRPAA
jgi:SAM-dependent methyltransferase